MNPMNAQHLAREKYNRNLLATRIVSGVTCVEQLLYGLLISEPKSMIQQIHYASALILCLLFIISMYLRKQTTKKIYVYASVYEMATPLIGMGIALIRILFHQGPLLSIPTVYLAVIYGGSVVFLYTYAQSVFLYGTLTFLAVLLVPRFQTFDSSNPIIADFLINGLIAWIVAAMNYKRFILLEEKTLLIEEQNKRLVVLSERDWLTGLYNRRKIDEVLQTLQSKDYSDGKNAFDVMLFDLDLFKEINDTYGHQVGDQVLRELSFLVEQHLQAEEICGRWGGEEFLIITKCDGIRLAEFFRQLIEKTIFANNVHITASFGVAHCCNYGSANELVKIIDQRLYKAKNLGRNQVIST